MAGRYGWKERERGEVERKMLLEDRRGSKGGMVGRQVWLDVVGNYLVLQEVWLEGLNGWKNGEVGTAVCLTGTDKWRNGVRGRSVWLEQRWLEER